jgi:hypothetical protein
MVLTLAVRTLLAHPVRTAVLAAGFGVGVAVMAILLGVAEIVLQQARAPELSGGGDVLVTGVAGQLTTARVLFGGALRTPTLGPQVVAAAPWSRTTVYLLTARGPQAVRARGGIPSRERALGDPETADQPAWTDTPEDRAWVSPDAGAVLRTMDRFHPIPDVPARADSWAEWLYFNGRSPGARFYLTFLAGPRTSEGRRRAGVRLQLDRGGRVENFDTSTEIDEHALESAPDLTIAGNSVRLHGARYEISLNLRDGAGRSVTGTLVVTGRPEALLPPFEVHGAAGWRTGYVVPVMAGSVDGTLTVDGARIDFAGGAGYHDHNWGFWQGVSWQWGQVQHGETSFVYGRVLPPRNAADPSRMPGFLAALGAEGVMGYATTVTIDEVNDAGNRPRHITVRGRSERLDLTFTFNVESMVATRMDDTPIVNGMDFLQMRGDYTVSGRIGDRDLQFTAPGSAETFRGR